MEFRPEPQDGFSSDDATINMVMDGDYAGYDEYLDSFEVKPARYYVMVNGGWEGDEFDNLSDALRCIATMIDRGRTGMEIIDRMPGGSQYKMHLREMGPAIPRVINVFTYTGDESYHSYAIRDE